MNKQLYLSINDSSQSIWGSYVDEKDYGSTLKKIIESEKNNSRNYFSTILEDKKNNENIKDLFINFYSDNLFLINNLGFVLPNIENQVTTSSESSSKCNIIKEDIKTILKNKESTFILMLNETKFVDGMDNRVTEYFSSLLTEYSTDVLLWIQDIFLQNINNEKIVVKILSLFMDYSYNDLLPASQMIALASREHRSIAVKSAVFSLFGHWCNKESLELLEAYNEPQEPWLKMKYDTLKNVIKKRCGM